MSAFTRPGSRHVHTKLSHKEYIDPFAVPLVLELMPLPKHILVNLPPKPLETSMVSFPKTTTKRRRRRHIKQRSGARISLAGRRHYRESINVDASRFIPFSRQQLSPPAHHAHCPPPPSRPAPPQKPAASLLLASSACT